MKRKPPKPTLKTFTVNATAKIAWSDLVDAVSPEEAEQRALEDAPIGIRASILDWNFTITDVAKRSKRHD